MAEELRFKGDSHLEIIECIKKNKFVIRIIEEREARLKEELEKILISLAYQKVDGELKRVNIDHRKVMKRFDEVFKEE